MLFESIDALKRQPNSDEALKLLKRAALQVQPIMKKRSWKVKKLVEFFPSNPALLGLNVNRGHTIKIRLRPARDNSAFLPYEDVLGTMLHELVHIIRGPHDDQFYKLLDELWEEVDQLMLKGVKINDDLWTGEGKRLGGRNYTDTEIKQKMREAAEARSRRIQGGVYTLGGSSYGGNVREMAVKAALKRRQEQDDKSCGSGCNDDVIVIESDDDDEVVVVDVKRGSVTCLRCTLINTGVDRCVACGSTL